MWLNEEKCPPWIECLTGETSRDAVPNEQFVGCCRATGRRVEDIATRGNSEERSAIAGSEPDARLLKRAHRL